ncbi:MAG: TetR/AcrR family transcriptional regulator [Deltaproteobacteria bacterium]|nr:MAG: TetR/AcrR family transcriptional regulator [Deltaproteobacteria bacterium]
MDSDSPDVAPPAPRKFVQDRSRRTYEALVDAAFRVFADKGLEDAQTPDIAAAAGVSVGTFYRYFADKRAAFLEVARRYLEEGERAVMSQLSADNLAGKQRRATIDHTLEVLIDQCLRSPRLEAVLTSAALRDPEIARLRARMENSSCAKLAELIRAATTRDQCPDPDATARVVHTAVVENAVRIAGLRGDTGISRERALAALGALVRRTVFGSDPDDE